MSDYLSIIMYIVFNCYKHTKRLASKKLPIVTYFIRIDISFNKINATCDVSGVKTREHVDIDISFNFLLCNIYYISIYNITNNKIL
jgi:hypothetical protein